MITGFNTDVEHGGVVYHVQTEDKGLESPLILSLVYVGGAILASKRSLYHDLIARGFNETLLAERLQRQHKLICAAINAGRIEDLKRMNQPREATETPPAPPAEPQKVESSLASSSERPVPGQQGMPAAPAVRAPVPGGPTRPVQPEPFVVAGSGGPTAQADVTRSGGASYEDLFLDLLEERELRAGDFITFRIRVSSGSVEQRYGVPDADVTLKVLGTAFKPLICSARTDQDGVAVLFAGLPRFSSGRAAILIRASAYSHEAELRRIIQPA